MIAGGHGEENPNQTWFSSRGMWVTYILGIVLTHLTFLSLPFVSIPMAWTLTNLFHNMVTLYFFHFVKGTPWISTELLTPAYRELTYFEQIGDDKTKKFLIAVPIVVFLLTSLYSRNSLYHFYPNVASLVVITLPKLPQFHKVRLFGINKY